MTPNGISELRVWKMIDEALDKYDLGNSKRHDENSRKLDHLMWGILVTFATVAGALALEIIRFTMGK